MCAERKPRRRGRMMVQHAGSGWPQAGRRTFCSSDWVLCVKAAVSIVAQLMSGGRLNVCRMYAMVVMMAGGAPGGGGELGGAAGAAPPGTHCQYLRGSPAPVRPEVLAAGQHAGSQRPSAGGKKQPAFPTQRLCCISPLVEVLAMGVHGAAGAGVTGVGSGGAVDAAALVPQVQLRTHCQGGSQSRVRGLAHTIKVRAGRVTATASGCLGPRLVSHEQPQPSRCIYHL